MIVGCYSAVSVQSKENFNNEQCFALHFAPSQASSSRNSNVDNFWLDCHNPFKTPFKIVSTLRFELGAET